MEEIVPALVTWFALNSAVSTAFARRITGNKVPDGQTYPYAKLKVIGNQHKYHMKGYSGRNALVQCDIFDDDEPGADANAEIIRNALDGYKGMIGNLDAGMVRARVLSGVWNPENRNYLRILEIEVDTND